jgi:hypothetical protein
MHFSFFVVGFEAPSQSFPATPINKLDMLFMVDNSNVDAAFAAEAARELPNPHPDAQDVARRLPDLHIGVVSSSPGAGVYNSDEIPNCLHGGDQGLLQATAAWGVRRTRRCVHLDGTG